MDWWRNVLKAAQLFCCVRSIGISYFSASLVHLWWGQGKMWQCASVSPLIHEVVGQVFSLHTDTLPFYIHCSQIHCPGEKKQKCSFQNCVCSCLRTCTLFWCPTPVTTFLWLLWHSIGVPCSAASVCVFIQTTAEPWSEKPETCWMFPFCELLKNWQSFECLNEP